MSLKAKTYLLIAIMWGPVDHHRGLSWAPSHVVAVMHASHWILALWPSYLIGLNEPINMLHGSLWRLFTFYSACAMPTTLGRLAEPST